MESTNMPVVTRNDLAAPRIISLTSLLFVVSECTAMLTRFRPGIPKCCLLHLAPHFAALRCALCHRPSRLISSLADGFLGRLACHQPSRHDQQRMTSAHSIFMLFIAAVARVVALAGFHALEAQRIKRISKWQYFYWREGERATISDTMRLAATATAALSSKCEKQRRRVI